MKHNVLIFPCGSEIGLEINRSLRFSKDFAVYGASSTDDHGRFVFENYISDLPFVDNENFIEKISEIVDKYNIEFIFPAHDSVVLKLTQNQEKIKAKIVTSPLETCEIARSKKATYNSLKDIVRVPKIYNEMDELPFPVFTKPDVGQGSKGVLVANNPSELANALNKDNSLLILEYLPGDEYTVDCFTNRNGELLFVQPRSRDRIVNGISVNSKAVDDEAISTIAQKINSQLTFTGVWFFQLKKSHSGDYVLLEIAPRVAGTMALSRMTGANLPLLSLYDCLGIDVTILKNNFTVEVDRALESKYKLDISYSNIYVDFDDAVIFDGKVSYLLIALLYKSVNNGKRVILITKHIEEIKETLTKYRIANNLFDEIISLSVEDEKVSHISSDSIFIDDSFSERKKVFDKTGIPVFDISEAVELL